MLRLEGHFQSNSSLRNNPNHLNVRISNRSWDKQPHSIQASLANELEPGPDLCVFADEQFMLGSVSELRRERQYVALPTICNWHLFQNSCRYRLLGEYF